MVKKYGFCFLTVLNTCVILERSEESRQRWVLFFNGIKYLPVILERSEESRQRWVLFFNGIKYLPVILERT